jgi:hypothetical protein
MAWIDSIIAEGGHEGVCGCEDFEPKFYGNPGKSIDIRYGQKQFEKLAKKYHIYVTKLVFVSFFFVFFSYYLV